jgi:hypothetical protein
MKFKGFFGILPNLEEYRRYLAFPVSSLRPGRLNPDRMPLQPGKPISVE